MKKILLKLISFCCVLTLLVGCNSNTTKTKKGDPVSKWMEAFATNVQLLMYDEAELNKVSPKAKDYLNNIYHLLDKEESYEGLVNLKTINSLYGNENEIVVDEILYDALKLGVELTVLTDGNFNIGAGALADVWNYYYVDIDGQLVKESRFSSLGFFHEDPTEYDIEGAMLCTPTAEELQNILVFNEQNSSIKFNKLDRCSGKVAIEFETKYVVNEIKSLINEDLLETLDLTGTTNEEVVTAGINYIDGIISTIDDVTLKEKAQGIKATYTTKVENRLQKSVVLTLGALGKGYGIEKTKDYLTTITNKVFMLNAGSSSIVSSGGNPKREGNWNISIREPSQAPYTPESLVFSMNGKIALSTSGDDEQFYYHRDKDGNIIYDEFGMKEKVHHIVNPNSGHPENNWNTITIIASTRADILDAITTACFSMSSIEDIQNMIEEVNELYDIDAQFIIQKAKKDVETNDVYVEVNVSEDVNITSYQSFARINRI